jgi:hypothetical protein
MPSLFANALIANAQWQAQAAIAYRCTQCKHNLKNAGIKPKFHIYNERL